MGFNHHTAHLICNQMGFPRARKFTTRYQYHMENHVRYQNPISHGLYDMKYMIWPSHMITFRKENLKSKMTFQLELGKCCIRPFYGLNYFSAWEHMRIFSYQYGTPVKSFQLQRFEEIARLFLYPCNKGKTTRLSLLWLIIYESLFMS